MFHQARLKLTFLYSLIFLLLFWCMSLGIYVWMNRFFGDEQGKQTNHIRVHHERSLLEKNGTGTEPASDIVMDELRNVLLFLDVIVVFSVPAITWFLTGRTLAPVQKTHEREKNFFTNASHDLRTPLSILKGEIDLTLRKTQPLSTYKHVLQSNNEEVSQLIDLVETMLFFSRNSEQSQSKQLEPVDLTDIIIHTIATLQKKAKQKKLQLSFQPAKETIVIQGNKQLLQRLFANIIDNAIKYTAPKGNVTVQLAKEKQKGIVSVTDTGIGIAEEQQKKIFDRFYQGDVSRREKGYGLGLSIAQQISTYHQSTIQVKSTVGKGTTFTITFSLVIQTQGKNLS